jgi:dTDP-4-dehydrorhamnose reductase
VIAVIGAGGQLGKAFLRLLNGEAAPFTRVDLDLTRSDQIEPWVASTRPAMVINCAAYTAVDAAESDAETARLVNTTAVGRLAESTARHHVGLVTFSTDYVFDGTKETGYVESDTPHPLSVYGSTKLDGEHLVARHHPDALVIRTSWILSGTHHNFASTMLDLISKGSTVRVVDDQRGRPTMVDDLAVATMEAVEGEAAGLLHLANQGVVTWFDLAREIAVMGGYDGSLLTPIRTDELPRPAPRPANSVLDSERLEDLALAPLPHFRDGLQRAVDEIMSRADAT